MPAAAAPVAGPVLGGLAAGTAGALLGGGGSKQGSTTTTQTPFNAPYANDLFSRAQGALDSGQIARISPYVGQAAGALASGATNPNGLVSQAQTQLGSTLGGSYLSPTSNPYLAGAVQNALDQVRANVAGTFSGDNFDSSAHQEFLSRILGQTALPYYAQNYANERQNQLNATTLAPQLQGANAEQLARAAQLDQANLDQPYTALGRYQSLISGQGGGATTQPYFTNPGAQALGGALGGLQLYKAFGGPGLFGSAGNATVNNLGGVTQIGDYGAS